MLSTQKFCNHVRITYKENSYTTILNHILHLTINCSLIVFCGCYCHRCLKGSDDELWRDVPFIALLTSLATVVTMYTGRKTIMSMVTDFANTVAYDICNVDLGLVFPFP